VYRTDLRYLFSREGALIGFILLEVLIGVRFAPDTTLRYQKSANRLYILLWVLCGLNRIASYINLSCKGESLHLTRTLTVNKHTLRKLENVILVKI
jgi:hypothetical protein